jgi:hypothetical protein
MIKTFLILINNKCKCFSGKKLPEYPAQEEEVLLLEERVGEAKRLAATVKIYIELSYGLGYFSLSIHFFCYIDQLSWGILWELKFGALLFTCPS